MTIERIVPPCSGCGWQRTIPARSGVPSAGRASSASSVTPSVVVRVSGCDGIEEQRRHPGRLAAPWTPTFDRETAITKLDDGRYSATMATSWWVVRGPNGGYLAAVILRALTDAVDDPDADPALAHGPLRERAGRRRRRAPHGDRARRSFAHDVHVPHGAGRQARRARGRRVLEAAARARSSATSSCPRCPGPSSTSAPTPPREAPPIAHPLRDPLGDRSPAGPRHADAARARSPAAGSGSPSTGRSTRCSPPRSPTAGSRRRSAGSRSRSSSRPSTSRSTSAPSSRIPASPPTPSSSRRSAPTVAADGFLEEDGEIWAPDGTLLAQSRQLATILPLCLGTPAAIRAYARSLRHRSLRGASELARRTHPRLVPARRAGNIGTLSGPSTAVGCREWGLVGGYVRVVVSWSTRKARTRASSRQAS